MEELLNNESREIQKWLEDREYVLELHMVPGKDHIPSLYYAYIWSKQEHIGPICGSNATLSDPNEVIKKTYSILVKSLTLERLTG